MFSLRCDSCVFSCCEQQGCKISTTSPLTLQKSSFSRLPSRLTCPHRALGPSVCRAQSAELAPPFEAKHQLSMNQQEADDPFNSGRDWGRKKEARRAFHKHRPRFHFSRLAYQASCTNMKPRLFSSILQAYILTITFSSFKRSLLGQITRGTWYITLYYPTGGSATSSLFRDGCV